MLQNTIKHFVDVHSLSDFVGIMATSLPVSFPYSPLIGTDLARGKFHIDTNHFFFILQFLVESQASCSQSDEDYQAESLERL